MSTAGKFILFGIGGLFLLLIIGLGSLGVMGWGLFTDQARVALNNNSVIQRHLGTIDEIDTDFIATANESGENVFVFRIKGTKGNGVVNAEFISIGADAEEVHSGTLRLSSGQSYDLMTQDSR